MGSLDLDAIKAEHKAHHAAYDNRCCGNVENLVAVIEALREALRWVKAVNISSPTTQQVCDEALARVRGGTDAAT